MAEAAARAANDLADEDDPHMQALYADLKALESRMRDDDQPSTD